MKTDPVKAADVLAARRWMLWLLSSADSAAPPSLPAAAWQTSLEQERCAAPLRERIALRGDREGLPASLASALAPRAQAELQRILMARAQLLELDRLATEGGVDVVVLKGGVAALASVGAVDLVDVDVLAQPGTARTLARLLDAVGYAGEGFSSTQHLRSRVRPGRLLVEVHQNLDVGEREWAAGVYDRAEPISGTSRLHRLAPEDHLWHLLYHVGVLHPYRRSAIRDLLLTSSAVSECTAGQVDEMVRRATRLPESAAIGDFLATAQELSGGVEVHDRFARQATAMVVIRQLVGRLPLTGQPQASVAICASAMVSGWSDLRREWKRVRMRSIEESASRPIAWVERSLPAVGRLVRVSARAVRTLFAMVLALPIAAVALRTAGRLTRFPAQRAPEAPDP